MPYPEGYTPRQIRLLKEGEERGWQRHVQRWSDRAAAYNARIIRSSPDIIDTTRAQFLYKNLGMPNWSLPNAESTPRAMVHPALQHRVTRNVAQGYLEALQQSPMGTQLRPFNSGQMFQVSGARAYFRVGQETLSLPLVGPVYDRATGGISGYQDAVQLLDVYNRGGELGLRHVSKPFREALTQAASVQEARAAVQQRLRILRYADVDDYRIGRVPTVTSSMAMMNEHRFRVLPGTQIPLPGVEGLEQFSAYEIGGGKIFGVNGVQRQMITSPTQIAALHGPLLAQVSRMAGRELFYDPLTESPMGRGGFSTLNMGQIDPWGNLQRGGFKIGQQFRTMPLNRKGAARAAGALKSGLSWIFGGRMVQTFAEHHASVKAAGFVAGQRGPLLTGLNVPGLVLFGSTARRAFTESNEQIVSRALSTELSGRTGGMIGVGAPTYTSTGKGMIAKVGDVPGVFQTMRPGTKARPADLMNLYLGGFGMAAQNRGITRETFLSHVKSAIGADKFMPGQEAVLRQGVSLFQGMNPNQGLAEVTRILGSLGKSLGVSPEDFIQRDRSGRVVGMAVMEHFGIRDIHESRSASALRGGLGIGGGHRVARHYASMFEGLGAPTLAKTFREIRRNPALMTSLDFRNQVLGTLAHLVDDQFTGLRPTRSAQTVTLQSLQEQLSGHWGAIDKILEQVGPSRVGLAAKLQQQGILGDWFGAGRMLDLGDEVAVAGKLNIGGAFAGSLRHIPIPALEQTNIGDTIASRVINIARGKGMGTQVSGLAGSLLDAYVGGKSSLTAALTSPTIGAEFVSRFQSGVMRPGEYRKQVSQYLQNLHKAGELNAGQLAEMDPMKHGHRYGFIQDSRIGEAQGMHRAYLQKHGYLPTLGFRDPVHAQAVAMRVLPIRMKHMPPALRDALQRADPDAVFGSLGDIWYLHGDKDFDHLRNLIVAPVEGDPTSQALYRGFKELEAGQSMRMRTADIMGLRAFAAQTGKAQDIVTGMADVLGGRAANAGLLESFQSTMHPTERLASEVGQMGVKMLTGHTYDPANLRMTALGAFDATGSSLFGPNEKWLRQYYQQDFLQGIQQLVINKHDVAGKESLAVISELNENLRRAAAGGKDAAVYRTQARENVAALASSIHNVLGGEGRHIATQMHMSRLFDPSGRMLPAVAERLTEVEMAMFPHIETAKGHARHLKDAYSPDDVRTMISQATMTLPEDPVTRQMIQDITGDLQSGLEVVETARAKAQTAEAVAQRVVEDTAAPRTTREMVRGIYESTKDAIMSSRQNKVAAGLAGAAVVGLAAIGILRMAGRAADSAMKSNAGQEHAGAGTPRSEYYVPEESMAGHMLNGRMNLPPEAIGGMVNAAHSMDGMADVRVMDSRLRLSNRMLGYDAEHAMESLYARSQLR